MYNVYIPVILRHSAPYTSIYGIGFVDASDDPHELHI